MLWRDQANGGAVREPADEFKLAPHRLDKTAKRREQHVAALLDP
jgi:hypothetical protein